MRIIILLILGLLIFSLLYLSDFFLSNIIKEKINECNRETQEQKNFKAVSLLKIIFLGTIFWLIPLAFFPEGVKLEYKILLTLFYWLIVSLLVFQYLVHKTTIIIAKKCIPLLVLPALLSGVFFVPLYVISKDLFL